MSKDEMLCFLDMLTVLSQKIDPDACYESNCAYDACLVLKRNLRALYHFSYEKSED